MMYAIMALFLVDERGKSEKFRGMKGFLGVANLTLTFFHWFRVRKPSTHLIGGIAT